MNDLSLIATRSKLLKANQVKPKRHKANTNAVMVYLDDDLLIRLDEFSRDHCKSKSSLAREALEARLSESPDNYVSGFNDGLNAAVMSIKDVDAFQIRFPSGKTFMDLLADEVAGMYRERPEKKED